MRYTYRRERFWYDHKTSCAIVSGVVLILISAIVATQVMPVGAIFGIMGICILLVGIATANKRLKEQMEHRNEMMSKGYRSKGKVVDAGGKYSLKTEYTGHRDENNNRQRISYWRSNWWIEVEYYDEVKGIPKRFVAQNMNKNGKLHGIIGRDAEVYNLNDFIYINIPGQ